LAPSGGHGHCVRPYYAVHHHCSHRQSSLDNPCDCLTPALHCAPSSAIYPEGLPAFTPLSLDPPPSASVSFTPLAPDLSPSAYVSFTPLAVDLSPSASVSLDAQSSRQQAQRYHQYSLGRPNKAGLQCPSVRPYTKSYLDLNEI